MKEIFYTFNNRGCYLPNEAVSFETETDLRLIIEPHEFELQISHEVLRKSSCKGYIIEISCRGEVHFYDYDKNLLAAVNETQKEFPQVDFTWKQDQLCLNFGRMITVDYYPNCDGESDRWGKEWVSEYEVSINTITNQTETTE